MPFDLGDYVDVNERLLWFFERYPEGSLQADILERGHDFVVIKALAYRSPADTRPGSGMASEPVPGRTPYTKDSEVMVGETSAWGRALAAIGAPTKGSIASRQEVSNRRSSPAGGPQSGVPTTEPAEAPQAGDTSSASQGRDGADMEPGEGIAIRGGAAVAPSLGFPIAESDCDHKGASGHWLPTKVIDGQARCPRCGASALIYKRVGVTVRTEVPKTCPDCGSDDIRPDQMGYRGWFVCWSCKLLIQVRVPK